MRAACYARTSTLDQAREEKVSIPTQVKWAKQFAQQRGWEFVSEYIEPGIFGDTEAETREAFSKLLEDVRLGKIDIVLIYHSSRFAREADIGMRMCRLLGQKRVQTYFRNATIEPVDPANFYWGTNIGSMYLTAFSFIGDFKENVDRSERVRDGFYGLAERGKLVTAPFGYKKVPIIKNDPDGRQRYDWTFEIDPQAAIVVQRIFNDYAREAGSLRQMMLKLNSELIPSPTGKVGSEAWSTTTLRNILQNVAYIGKVRWGRKLGGKYKQGKSGSGKQRRITNSPDKWIIQESFNHKGFIEESLFNRVQDKLKLRGVLKGRAVASKGLLTGLVICGRCNKKAYFKHRNGARERDDYVCSSYFTYKSCQRHVMAGTKLHDLVLTEIDKLASAPDNIESILDSQSVGQNESAKQQLELLRKEYKELSSRLQRILIAYETGNISLDEFGKAKERLDNQASKTQLEIIKLEKALDDKNRSELAKKRFINILKDFSSGFTQMDIQKQKDYIQTLISSLVVKGDSVHIDYRL